MKVHKAPEGVAEHFSHVTNTQASG